MESGEYRELARVGWRDGSFAAGKEGLLKTFLVRGTSLKVQAVGSRGAALRCTSHGLIFLHSKNECALPALQENQENATNLVISDTELKQVAYVFKCTNSTLQIKGKINSITLGKRFGP